MKNEEYVMGNPKGDGTFEAISKNMEVGKEKIECDLINEIFEWAEKNRTDSANVFGDVIAASDLLAMLESIR